VDRAADSGPVGDGTAIDDGLVRTSQSDLHKKERVRFTNKKKYYR
jgi:hypothetical protein